MVHDASHFSVDERELQSRRAFFELTDDELRRLAARFPGAHVVCANSGMADAARARGFLDALEGPRRVRSLLGRFQRIRFRKIPLRCRLRSSRQPEPLRDR